MEALFLVLDWGSLSPIRQTLKKYFESARNISSAVDMKSDASPRERPEVNMLPNSLANMLRHEMLQRLGIGIYNVDDIPNFRSLYLAAAKSMVAGHFETKLGYMDKLRIPEKISNLHGYIIAPPTPTTRQHHDFFI